MPYDPAAFREKPVSADCQRTVISVLAMVRAMRAVTVIPGQQGSVALTDVPEPPAEDGPIVVQTQAIGICGTDLEIINGEYGISAIGQDRLIIGHESLGRG